jgi:hypothetical protein
MFDRILSDMLAMRDQLGAYDLSAEQCNMLLQGCLAGYEGVLTADQISDMWDQIKL